MFSDAPLVGISLADMPQTSGVTLSSLIRRDAIREVVPTVKHDLHKKFSFSLIKLKAKRSNIIHRRSTPKSSARTTIPRDEQKKKTPKREKER